MDFYTLTTEVYGFLTMTDKPPPPGTPTPEDDPGEPLSPPPKRPHGVLAQASLDKEGDGRHTDYLFVGVEHLLLKRTTQANDHQHTVVFKNR